MVVWACLCVGGTSENFLLKTRYINSLFDLILIDWLTISSVWATTAHRQHQLAPSPAVDIHYRQCCHSSHKTTHHPWLRVRRGWSLYSLSPDVCSAQHVSSFKPGTYWPHTHWQQCRPYRQQSWTIGNKVDRDKLSNSRCWRFVAKTGSKVERIGNEIERIRQQSTLLSVSATVDFQQSWPCWIQPCRQCVPGFETHSKSYLLRLCYPRPRAALHQLTSVHHSRSS